MIHLYVIELKYLHKERVPVPAFKPPKIADSSNKNQRPGVNKFYLNIRWEGTNPRLGRTILNLVIGTILKSIQQKDT